MRLFRPLLAPVSTAPFLPASQFTVCTSRFTRPRKNIGNGNVQANVRANNSGQIEDTAHENVGFQGKKGQKVHLNFAPNITMEFHYHAFPTLLGLSTISNLENLQKIYLSEQTFFRMKKPTSGKQKTMTRSVFLLNRGRAFNE